MRADRSNVQRVAFDIGGTFTDVIVLFKDGTLSTLKILSMLERVGEDIRNYLQPHGGAADSFVHGTTVATNAILEDKLPPVALLTTRGFRDVLEMRTQRRPNVYDVNWKRTPSLVPRERVYEVGERIASSGDIGLALDAAEVAAQVEAVKASGAKAVAICLINSFRNPAHEFRLEAALGEAVPGLPVSASARDFAEIREYERTSTTVVNAALRPIVDDYLTRLESQLGVSDRDLQVMQSNGGLVASATARRRPVTIIESGPAAGVMAAARIATEAGLARALAFDMGGTTAKATLIMDGKPLEKPSGEVGAGINIASRFYGGWGHAVQVPTLDIAEVSAGGGSIAWIDGGGALRVGPEGAGAQPGPACYGRGGMRPTVTDANVVLGYINPAGLAGQTLSIDRDAAAAAIERDIARPLGLGLLEAAAGIVRVANAATMRALRAVSIERGVDPRGVSIIAFGGAGPIHATQLGEVLGVASVVVPPFPGIFSAVGLLLAEFRYDGVRSLVVPLDRLDRDDMERHFAGLRDDVRQAMAAQGIDLAAAVLKDYVDVRYKGQDKSLMLEFAAPDDGRPLGEHLLGLFTAEHLAQFGYRRDDPAEIVALRVRGTAGAGATAIADIAAAAGHEAPRNRRQVCFDPRLGPVEIPTLSRDALSAARTEGPMIVEERDTSIVVPPGWSARIDGLRNVILEKAREPQK
ncbi:MAG: hydantoinase/oxoprolinase family protein [Reyranellaceae bacterium]